MTDIYKKNQAAYDQIVMEFARLNHTDLKGDMLVLAQKFIQQVGRNGSVLDIGCGTGRDIAYFELQGLHVTGLDLSAGMLAYARQQVHAGLVMMNMCRLGFRTAHFDGAWSCASLLHLPKQAVPSALQEICRVLKPGGQFYLTIQEGASETWNGGYIDGVMRFFARYQADEMKALLTNNGFSVAEIGSFQGYNQRIWLSYRCTSQVP
jgi:ubiquinone/menaquinone biosynthesis C-methylase UbiE